LLDEMTKLVNRRCCVQLAIDAVPRALPMRRNASRWTSHATHRSGQVAFVLFTIQSME
jgi:hypothetical protein